MKIFVERLTNQLILPGIITENPDCNWENGLCGERDDTSWLYCDEGKIRGHYSDGEDCSYCKGTGKLYDEVEYANQERT